MYYNIYLYYIYIYIYNITIINLSIITILICLYFYIFRLRFEFWTNKIYIYCSKLHVYTIFVQKTNFNLHHCLFLLIISNYKFKFCHYKSKEII